MRHSMIGAAFAVAAVLSTVSMTEGQQNRVNWNQLRNAATQAQRDAEQTFNHNVTACRRRFEHRGLRPVELDRRAVGRETSNAIRQITLGGRYVGRDGHQHNLPEIWDGQRVEIYDTQAGNFGGVNILGTNIVSPL